VVKSRVVLEERSHNKYDVSLKKRKTKETASARISARPDHRNKISEHETGSSKRETRRNLEENFFLKTAAEHQGLRVAAADN